MRIHPNPEINAYLQKFVQEDGSVRVPKEAQEKLLDLIENDMSQWEDSPRSEEPTKSPSSEESGPLPK